MAHVADHVNLEGIAYDRYRHRELAQDLADMGIDLPMIEHPQGFRRMPRASDGKGDFIKGADGQPIENPLWMPTSAQELENLIVEQKIRIAFNPLLHYNASCVVLRHDPSGVGNFIFDKRKSKNRIDGVVALSMGVGYAKLHPSTNIPSIYETRGLLIL
jgi:phage terminase large subunit-like protein